MALHHAIHKSDSANSAVKVRKLPTQSLKKAKTGFQKSCINAFASRKYRIQKKKVVRITDYSKT